MSDYRFSPSPDFATKENNFAYWDNGFNAKELEEIQWVGDNLPFDVATVGNNEINEKVRKSRTSWIQYQNCPWIYDRMAWIARRLNGEFFDFDLYGFSEDFQYTIYEAGGSHYDWHMDKGMPGGPPRKLSLVLQLSDPETYDGGELQLMTGKEEQTLERKLGLVYAFPSFVLHRVMPVTRGIRKSLVVWITGPKFR